MPALVNKLAQTLSRKLAGVSAAQFAVADATIAALFGGAQQGAWFNPGDLSTLFQDAAGTVPVTAAGQTVLRMNDKSGRGHHASSSAGMILRLDASNRYYLECDGTTHYMEFSNIPVVTDSCTNVAVQITGGAATFRALWSQRPVATEGEIMYAEDNNSWAHWASNAGVWATANTAVNSVVLNSTFVISARHTNTLVAVRQNATEFTTAMTSFTTTTAVGRLMAGGDTVVTFFTPGRFYGGIMVARVLTAQETSDVRTYLAERSGGTLV